MNNSFSKNEEKKDIKNNNMQQIDGGIGLDQDEQVMNGLYGMAETDTEDAASHDTRN